MCEPRKPVLEGAELIAESVQALQSLDDRLELETITGLGQGLCVSGVGGDVQDIGFNLSDALSVVFCP